MFTAPQPFLSRGLFRDRNFIVSSLIAFVSMTIAFATSAIMPSMLQSVYGYPVLTAGFLLAPRGIGGLFSMALCGRLANRVDPRFLVGSGLLIVAISMWLVSHFNYGVSETRIMFSGVVQGFGTGLVFAPMTNLTFSTLPPQYRTEASSMFGLLRSMGGAVGVSIIANLIQRLDQENHANLVEHVTPFNSALHTLMPIAGQGSIGAVLLDGEVNRQAAMISYTDVFSSLTFMTAACVLMLPLVRLSKGVVLEKPEPVEA
jgi:DHA2 family multidrug resistance protein